MSENYMNRPQPPVATTKYLKLDPAESEGTPLDKRLKTRNGLDWDLLRYNYAQNADASERAWQTESLKSSTGLKKEEKKELAAENPMLRLINDDTVLTHPMPPADLDLAIKYYQIGNKVGWIAEELGYSRETIKKNLIAVEVYIPGRDQRGS